MALVAAAGACDAPGAPELVITHARVFTNDVERPWAEAVAVRGGRIVAVGTAAEVNARARGAARVIDARGRVLVPGFDDARVDLPLGLDWTSRIETLAALDRRAVSRGVTSLQVVAGGPMTEEVTAARAAERQARWRLIRSPADGERPDDDEPFLPPQPGPRLFANGVAWTIDPGRTLRRRRPLPSDEIDLVVNWSYGAEDPLIAAAGPNAARLLTALGRRGVPEVWERKRPRLDLTGPLGIDIIGRLLEFGVVVTWLPGTADPAATTVGVTAGTLMDQGVVVALGSAGPPDPMAVLAAVTAARPSTSGRPFTREEAVRALTWGSAYAEKAERDKGWLGVGTLADLAVLSDDVFSVPSERLGAITSVLTVVGGAIVYDAGVLSGS
ncbi:MAG: amidohydrolase family protein [Vicinamibacterales bacterium]